VGPPYLMEVIGLLTNRIISYSITLNLIKEECDG
jgi:hypothetical protein